MHEQNNIQLTDYANVLSNKDAVSLKEYLETYKSRIIQKSEKLFICDFLFPLFDEKYIKYVIPPLLIKIKYLKIKRNV